MTEASESLLFEPSCPIIESETPPLQRFHESGTTSVFSQRLVIHLLYSREESTVISQDCDSSSVSEIASNSCGSVPGGRCDGTVLSYMPLRGGEFEIWWDESWEWSFAFLVPILGSQLHNFCRFSLGLQYDGMGLSWRVSSKIITSNWFWKPASWFAAGKKQCGCGNRLHCGWVMSMWPQCPAPVLKLTSVGTELSSCPISLCTEAELS